MYSKTWDVYIQVINESPKLLPVDKAASHPTLPPRSDLIWWRQCNTVEGRWAKNPETEDTSPALPCDPGQGNILLWASIFLSVKCESWTRHSLRMRHGMGGRKAECEVPQAWVQIPTLPFIVFANLGKLLNVSQPQFFLCQMRVIIPDWPSHVHHSLSVCSPYCRWHELPRIQIWSQCLPP